MSGDIEKITGPQETAKDEQIAKIENDLQAERDSRNTERFAWIFAIIILINMLAFPRIAWGPCFLIGFLEAALLLVLAKAFGIDEVYVIMQNCMDAISSVWRKP